MGHGDEGEMLEATRSCDSDRTLPREVDEILRRFRDGLEELYGDRLRGLYLFGSYARGEESTGSDVEVLVVLSWVESAWVEIRRTSEIRAEISLECEMTVSAHWISEQEWEEGHTPFLRRVREECVAT